MYAAHLARANIRKELGKESDHVHIIRDKDTDNAPNTIPQTQGASIDQALHQEDEHDDTNAAKDGRDNDLGEWVRKQFGLATDYVPVGTQICCVVANDKTRVLFLAESTQRVVVTSETIPVVLKGVLPDEFGQLQQKTVFSFQGKSIRAALCLKPLSSCRRS